MRFESMVALVLTLIVGAIILVALARLIQHVTVKLVLFLLPRASRPRQAEGGELGMEGAWTGPRWR